MLQDPIGKFLEIFSFPPLREMGRSLKRSEGTGNMGGLRKAKFSQPSGPGWGTWTHPLLPFLPTRACVTSVPDIYSIIRWNQKDIWLGWTKMRLPQFFLQGGRKRVWEPKKSLLKGSQKGTTSVQSRLNHHQSISQGLLFFYTLGPKLKDASEMCCSLNLMLEAWKVRRDRNLVSSEFPGAGLQHPQRHPPRGKGSFA